MLSGRFVCGKYMTPLKGKIGMILGNFFIKLLYKKNLIVDSDILLWLTIVKGVLYLNNCGHSSVVERLVANEKVEGSNPFARSIKIVRDQNLTTRIFQKYIDGKDIRSFKGNIFFYFYYRLSRFFFNKPLKIKINDLNLYSSHKKNKSSYSLLQKCNFFDVSEIKTIKKLNSIDNLMLIDCGCNFGYYSFYTASLSRENEVISIEASKNTLGEFNENLKINNFNNIRAFNKAVLDLDNQKIEFHESEKDWESSLLTPKFNITKKNFVDTITIDSLVKNSNLENKLLILKIDVEGADFNVLSGAKNTILEAKPFIIIEFSKYIFGNKKFNYDYLADFLHFNNYQIYGKNGNKYSVKDILNLLEKLDTVHDTIGNYYLINNDKKEIIHKIFN